jgi:hypothetical protein
MFEYFYNEIFRKTIISFGTLFNDITIKQTDSTVKVPLAYGPTQKFLARLEESPDLNKRTAMTLPRMSFEFTGLTYDPSRKVTTTQQITVKDPTTGQGSKTKKAFMPVPYNMQFELSVMTKLNDDALQIVEQILPYFQPSYNLTVQLVETIKEKRDIPIILESVTMDDQYEGNYTTRRVLMYTLRFSAKTYLFGPVSTATSDIIRKTSVNYIAGGSKSVERDVTYSVTPRATKDYTGDVLTNLTEDIDATTTTINVTDGTALTVKTYIDVDDEEMYVTKITSNKITVERGKDGRTAAAHVNGSEIKGITAADDALIEMGDDFGFSGEYTQDAGLF